MADRFTEQFVSFLRITPSQRRVVWWRGQLLQWATVIVAWFWLGLGFYLLRPVAFTFVGSSNDFSQPNVGNLAWDVMTILLIPIITIAFVAVAMPTNTSWYGAAIVRAVALRGKNAVAVGAIDQPEPLSGDEIPLDAKPLAALKLPSASTVMTVAAGVDLVLVAAMMVLAPFIWFRNLATGPDSLNDAVSLALLLLPVAQIGKIFALYGVSHVVPNGWWVLLPSRRKKLLAVDDFGIRWRERRWRRREYALAWHDISAFCVDRQLSGFSVTNVYLLLGETASFSWVVPARANSAQRAASTLLARLVVMRSLRPLLDITRSIEATKALEMPFGFMSKITAIEEPAQTLIAALAAAQNMPGSEPSSPVSASADPAFPVDGFGRPIHLRARFYWLHIALIVALAVGACSYLMVDQQRADDYHRGLYSRILAGTPLYTSALTSAESSWSGQVSPESGLTFANGGLTFDGRSNISNEAYWRGRHETDLAVAVTVRGIAVTGYGPVGLVVRSDTAHYPDDIEFSINPASGGWELMHYQPEATNSDDVYHFLEIGHVSAIHAGLGATNRLMLVVVGRTYLCYINGQLVGGAVDSSPKASPPHPGYVGLYVLGDSVAVFNDFAVYPAPPPYTPLPGLG
jgi:hypothetical protein